MALFGQIKNAKTYTGIAQQNSWYENCFYGELFPIWKYTPFVGDGTRDYGEIKNMCYHRSLSLMLKDNETGETARRQMLYYYLSPYWTQTYESGAVTSVLDEVFSALSSDNTYLTRALKNICTLYDNPPLREIKGKNDEKIKEVLTESNFDDFLGKMYLILKFTNQVLYRPVFNLVNGEKLLRHKLYTADRYRCIYDSYGNITEIWIPKVEIVNDRITDVIYIWTAETIKKVDSNGKALLIDGQAIAPNPYGKIPFLELKIDNIEDDKGEVVGGTYYELLKAQLDCNAIDIDINQSLIYDSFPIKTFINYGIKNTDEIVVSPGRVYVKDFNEQLGESAPFIAETGGADNYLSLFELKLNRIKQALKNMGLPSSVIEDNPGIPESGVAIKESQKETLQLRREDINSMKRVEKQVVKLIIELMNKDEASPLWNSLDDFKNYEISINYQEIEVNKEFDVLKTEQDALLNLGYISVLEHYQTLTGDNEISDIKELIKLIEKNKKYLELLEGNKDDSGATSGNATISATNGTSPELQEAGGAAEEVDDDGNSDIGNGNEIESNGNDN